MKSDDENKMDIREVEKRIESIEQSIKQLRVALKHFKDNQLPDKLNNEVPLLKEYAWKVITYLIVLTVLSSIGALWLLLSNAVWIPNLKAGLVSLAAGLLGSSISAMLSALQRRANGWEFSDGSTFPGDEPKERFNESMIPFFLARPFLGMAVGFLAFVGGLSAFLIDVGTPPDLYELAFIALLAGLFAKTLLDKPKEVFDNLVGK